MLSVMARSLCALCANSLNSLRQTNDIFGNAALG